MPYIPTDQYATASAYDLLQAAADGFIGFDQRLIHALVDDPKRTLPDIVRFAESVTDDSEFNLDLELIHIFHQLNAPEAAPFYVSLIRACVNEIPDELTEAVVALGTPMLEPLLALYAEIGEEEGGEIAFMLAGLGVRDQRVLDLLLERLEYDAADGAISLSLYADPAAIPHITRILNEVPAADKDLRHALQSAIEQIESSAAEPELPAPPFNIFELYEEEQDPEFRTLSEEQRVSLLAPESLAGMPPHIRALAAGSFENDELSQPARTRLLELAKSDPDPNVRGRAWESLAYEAGEPDVRPLMIAAARSAPLDERTGAAIALASGPEPADEISDLIAALYSEPAARAKTLEAMWKSLDRRFQKYMVQHVEDPDIVVRHQAITGIGYLGIGSEAPRLVGLFNDEEFRENALLAYALAVPTEVSRARMKPLLRRITELAGGLSFAEEEMLREVLDQRLVLHGQKPVFHTEDRPDTEESVAVSASPGKSGRNDACPCGSGKKYKKCHGA